MLLLQSTADSTDSRFCTLNSPSYRQIAQTIKFDAEEALSINAAETAVAFEIAGKGLSGSEVSAFAAPANVISEIILALQNNKLDPVTVEPDSICLRRVVQYLTKAQTDSKPMWMAAFTKEMFYNFSAGAGRQCPGQGVSYRCCSEQNRLACKRNYAHNRCRQSRTECSKNPDL